MHWVMDEIKCLAGIKSPSGGVEVILLTIYDEPSPHGSHSTDTHPQSKTPWPPRK